ncbi:hypothetical protein EXE43_17910 [Halorubrum sp. SS5]|nr:hypothetical protein EXE43_17910 [Halorubrum sp. SS5]
MDFKTLLRNTDRTDTREVIGRSIYYLEEEKGQDLVTVSDIVDLIDESRMQAPSGSSVAAYIRHMLKDGTIKKRGDGYILTISGIEKFGEETKRSGNKKKGAKFISHTHIDDEFYDSLVSNINRCYQADVNEATLVLTRKLVENLLIDLLRAKYGHSDGNIELFYDTENRQFRRFSRLIDNLETNIHDFEYYSDRMDEDIIPKIKQLKGGGDASAHSIELAPSEDAMHEYRSKANSVVDVLSYTLSNINQGSD